MAAAGRPVSLLTISEWRRHGLMPPLATASRGRNRGKTCFWIEENALERAALVHDLFNAGVERHEVYWLLWLCGLSVPLPKLRRAWLHKASSARRVAAARMLAPRLQARRTKSGASLSAQTLLEIALVASALLDHSSDPEIDALIEALDSIGAGAPGDPACEGRHQVVALVKAVWSSLRTSDLIIRATDDDLRAAQVHTSTALRRFQETGRSKDWPIAEAKSFGAPLFFLVLLFLRSDERGLLEYITRCDRGEGSTRYRENELIRKTA